MFIPPLPKHNNTDANTGWAFVCDILLRLPLCIFIRLVSITCTSEELENFLSHPLKKNLLVKDLPPHLRQSLLQGRRYVTYVIDLINRLCYMGESGTFWTVPQHSRPLCMSLVHWYCSIPHTLQCNYDDVV